MYYSGHSIVVDGDYVTYTYEWDNHGSVQPTSTSVALHLEAGQRVGIDPDFGGTVRGVGHTMHTTFGVTLLHRD